MLPLVSAADYGLRTPAATPAAWAHPDHLLRHARHVPELADVRRRLLWHGHGLRLGVRGDVLAFPETAIQPGDVVTAYDGLVVDPPTLEDLLHAFPPEVVTARLRSWPNFVAFTVGLLQPVDRGSRLTYWLQYHQRYQSGDVKPAWPALVAPIQAPHVLAADAADDHRGLGAYIGGASAREPANVTHGMLVSPDYVARMRDAEATVRWLIEMGRDDRDNPRAPPLTRDYYADRVRDVDEPWHSFLPVVVATRTIRPGEKLVITDTVF